MIVNRLSNRAARVLSVLLITIIAFNGIRNIVLASCTETCDTEAAQYCAGGGVTERTQICNYSTQLCEDFAEIAASCSGTNSRCRSEGHCGDYVLGCSWNSETGSCDRWKIWFSCCQTYDKPICNPDAHCCTPQLCGSGYQETPNDCAPVTLTCEHSSQCSSDECRAAGRPSERKCYPVETNTNPSDPTWLRIDSDGIEGPGLSETQSDPTLIRLPFSPSSSTKMVASSVSQPAGSREYGYRFFVNKADVYADRLLVTSNLRDNPVNQALNLPLASILTEGSTGMVATNVYSRNKCNEGTTESPILRTYYQVNSLPRDIGLTISGTNARPGGCTPSPSYTGTQANNPLTIEVTGTDPNGNSTINGMFLWLVKDGFSIPSTYLNKSYGVGPGTTTTDPNVIGLFFGSNLAGTGVSVYKSNNNSTTLHNWGRDWGSTSVKDAQGRILINEITVSRPSSGRFIVTLKFPTTSPLVGKYNFYTALTDTLTYYTIGSVTSTELRRLYNNGAWNWNFDFIAPNKVDLTNSVINQREFRLGWDTEDVGPSGIQNVVINTYTRNSETPNPYVIMNPPSPNHIGITKEPSITTIGRLPAASGSAYTQARGATSVNIGNNSYGLLRFFLTAYDGACNFNKTDQLGEYIEIDLNRWISTRGGILFSQGAVGYIPKKILEHNLGTELISTSSASHPVRNVFEAHMNPTSVIGVKDGNTLPPDRFQLLSDKLDRYKLGLKPITTLSGCLPTEVCIMNSSSIGSLTGATTYRGKIIVVSEGDMTVTPDIKAGNPATDGLILFAKGNITINSTTTKSSFVTVGYDQLDAFMIARGQISIPKEPANINDGLTIYGSLTSFARNVDPGILLHRDLGLLNVSNPVLIVNYHPKYTRISELFFGTDNSAYKQEVGFKIL